MSARRIAYLHLAAALLGLVFLAACARATSAPTTAPAAEAPAAEEPMAEAPVAEAPAAAPAAPVVEIPVLEATPIAQPNEAIQYERANALRLLGVWGTAAFEQAIYSPDGRSIAAIASPGIFLYDASLARTAWLNTGGEATRLVYTPDSLYLVAGLEDGWLQVWAVQDQARRYAFPAHPGSVTALALAPDGQTLASCGQGDPAIRLWNASDARRLAVLDSKKGPCTSLSFSSEGLSLAVGLMDGSVQVWDTNTGQLNQSTATGTDPEFTAPVASIAFSPANPGLLGAAAQDGGVKTWQIGANGASLQVGAWQAQFPDVIDLAFSPDGQWLAYASKVGLVQVQPLNNASLPFELAADGAPLNSLDFSPDSQELLLASNTLQGWNLQQRQVSHNLEEIHRQPTSLVYSPDGAWVVVGTEQGAIEERWATDGSLIRQFGGSTAQLTRLAISPDGSQIASGSENGELQIWSLADGSLLYSLVGHQATITGLSFSPDGVTLASSANDGAVLIWSLTDGATIASLAGAGRPVGARFSPDGALLAIAYDNGLLQFWQSGTWSLLNEIQTGAPVTQAEFWPGRSDRILTISPGGELKVWDTGSGGLLEGYQVGNGGLAGATLSPYGDAVATYGDFGLTLTGLTQMQSLQPPGGDTPALAAAAFSPDGRTLAAAGADGTLRIWGIAP